LPSFEARVTDHKSKRERSDAEIATEGAVTFPPFKQKAADFRAAAAARESRSSAIHPEIRQCRIEGQAPLPPHAAVAVTEDGWS
jgi:hypothetical protein